MMEGYRESNDRDLVAHQIRVIVADATRYASRPPHLGGGGGTFNGYQPIGKMRSSRDFDIQTSASGSWLTILGIGTVVGEDGQSPVQVLVQYDLQTNAWTEDEVN